MNDHLGRSPYEQAFNRIRAEFTEMPGMRLTPQQVERLSGFGNAICKLVLDDLVRARFLSVAADGAYMRSTDLVPVRASVPFTESSQSLTASVSQPGRLFSDAPMRD